MGGGAGTADPLRLIDGGLLSHGWYGILQSAGLLFFAFAGYTRIATMCEEVINLALGIAVAVDAIIAVSILSVLGPDGIAGTPAPLAAAVSAGSWDWASPIVRVGAALAALGALLALIAGLGRTSLAMAREAELPRWLSAIHPRFKVPHRAETVLAAVICLIMSVADLRGAIGFSSSGVLIYYVIANLAAFTQTGENRRYPKALQAVGALACVLLVATLPVESVIAGLVMFGAGTLYRVLRLRREAMHEP